MRIMCVDDEELILQLTISMCKGLPQDPEVKGFTHSREALEWIKDNPADVALLDIDMPDMDGLELAESIKELSPDTAIIFLTGYEHYAVDAFAMHASGYLLKPISKERLQSEVNHALSEDESERDSRVTVQTFGGFEVFVRGVPITFYRAKAKEVLAMLVDKQGNSVTRADIFAQLWEEGKYDRSMQKQLDVIIRSLRKTLQENGIEDILEMSRGSLRIHTELINCDMYRFLAGDEEAINSYRGEYMNTYAWADYTEAYLTQLKEEKR